MNGIQKILHVTRATVTYFAYLLVHALLALSPAARAYPGWQGQADNPCSGELIKDTDPPEAVAGVEEFSVIGPLLAGHLIHLLFPESDLKNPIAHANK